MEFMTMPLLKCINTTIITGAIITIIQRLNAFENSIPNRMLIAILLCTLLLSPPSSSHPQLNFMLSKFACCFIQKIILHWNNCVQWYNAPLLTSTIITIIIIFGESFYGRCKCRVFCDFVWVCWQQIVQQMWWKNRFNWKLGSANIFDELSNELRQPKQRYTCNIA